MEITDDNFEQEVLNSDIPVLLDFWATWCVPCNMLSPILDSISNKFDSRIKVAKLNIDNNRKIPVTYKISSIPTIIFFKDGKRVETLVGVVSESKLISVIEGVLC